jgi:transcriptional regulator of acetoin/glycerol metabolism
MERSHVAAVLKQNNWNISTTAQVLGIDRTTLYKKIKKYNLEQDKQ